MTSSEKILAGITEEAQKKADEIIKKAELAASEIIAKQAEKSDADAKKVITAAEKKASITESTGRSSAALLKRDAALTCRRTLIEKVLDDTVDTINAYDDEKYFDYLLNLVGKGAGDEKGELLLSKHDLSRDTLGFEKKIAEYNLTLGKTPADLNGGFILKYNDILINCGLKALIREKRELLVDSVNSALFG